MTKTKNRTSRVILGVVIGALIIGVILFASNGWFRSSLRTAPLPPTPPVVPYSPPAVERSIPSPSPTTGTGNEIAPGKGGAATPNMDFNR